MSTNDQNNSNPPGDKKPEPTWRDTLPDDLKNEPSLQAIGSIDVLAKSYVHAQKAVGADKIVKPSKHATDDDWKKVFKDLGVPEEKDYKLDLADEEKSVVDEKFTEFFGKLAAQEQLFPNKAKKVLLESAKFIKQVEADRLAKVKQDQQKALDGLKTEWGAAYDLKSQKAQLAFNTFGKDIPELKQFLETSGLGNNPNVIKMFAAVGETLKEGKTITTTPNNVGGPMTPKEAEKAANVILGNFEHPYYKVDHPNHKAAVEEMRDYFKMMHPDNQPA